MTDGRRALGEEADVEIRHVRPDDLALIRRYFEGLSEDSRRTFFPRPFDEAHAQFIVESAEGECTVRLAAVEGGEIVGYCYFQDRGAEGPPGVGLGVIDRAQGRGIGTRLMAALVAEARRLGKRGLALTVHKGNARALRIYARNGYRILGDCADDPAKYTMALDLTDADGQ